MAFLSVSSRVGGSEMLLLQLLKELHAARPGWATHLVVPEDGPLASQAAALGTRITVVPMPAALLRLGESGLGGHLGTLALRLARAALDVPRYQARLSAALTAIDPDVIHSNGFKAHIVAARINRGRAALVWHMHEYVAARPVTRLLIRRYAGRADAVVANSESVAADVRAVAGTSTPVAVIYNAVDLDRFSPSGPACDLDRAAGMAPAPQGTVRAGLVATFSRWKGHEVFLRAIASMPAARGVRAYVVGGALYDTDGSQRTIAELRTLAAELGIADRVGFTGFVEAPETVFRALDIVVHASTEPEAFGLVIAEAMACGRAVVTSATGGSAELVHDGEDAQTHRPGDHASLAACLSALAADPVRRRRLGAAARAAATDKFDARRLAGQFETLYAEARQARAAR